MNFDDPTPGEPNPADGPDDGPTLEEAKEAAAHLEHTDDPAAADLPADVKFGDKTPDDGDPTNG